MNESIVSKLSIFQDLSDGDQAIAKFSAAVSMESYEDLVEKYEFIKLNGITITLASELKIFALSLDEMKRQISVAKQYGFLPSLLKADLKKGQYIGPSLMLYKNLDKRLEYAVKNNIPYRNEDGYIFDNIVSLSLFHANVSKDVVINTSEEIRDEKALLVSDWLQGDEKIHSDAVWDLWGGEILNQLETVIETTPDEAMSSRLLKLLDLVEDNKISMKEAFLYSITYNKTLPDIEVEKYKMRIDDCLTDEKLSKYNGILTSDLEGANK